MEEDIFDKWIEYFKVNVSERMDLLFERNYYNFIDVETEFQTTLIDEYIIFLELNNIKEISKEVLRPILLISNTMYIELLKKHNKI